jgi:hypothetical protein
MGGDRLFDLAWVDVFAAANDQLLAATDQHQIPISVELAEVPRAKPATVGEGLGVGSRRFQYPPITSGPRTWTSPSSTSLKWLYSSATSWVR